MAALLQRRADGRSSQACSVSGAPIAAPRTIARGRHAALYGPAAAVLAGPHPLRPAAQPGPGRRRTPRRRSRLPPRAVVPERRRAQSAAKGGRIPQDAPPSLWASRWKTRGARPLFRGAATSPGKFRLSRNRRGLRVAPQMVTRQCRPGQKFINSLGLGALSCCFLRSVTSTDHPFASLGVSRLGRN